MIILILLLLCVGLAVSLPITALLVRWGHRRGLLDTTGATGHAKTLRRVPNIGGIAIYCSIALPMIVGLALVWLADGEVIRRVAPAMNDDLLQRVRHSTPAAVAMLFCLTALHAVGLLDDRRALGPWVKFLCQFGVAALMVVPDLFEVRLFTFLDSRLGLGEAPSILITILWVVAVTNAVNFLDNMDGLAGGVCAIAAVLFMIATILNAQWFIAGVLALLIGGLVGFLVFNFPPARIFMGDGGSLVVGFLLGILTARTTFYDPSKPDYALGGGWYGVFMPLVVLAIPLYDLVVVTAIRLKQGRSPLVGDQQHFSHRLVQRGLSSRGAVLVIWGATAITGIGGIALGSLEAWQAVLVGVQTLLVLMIIGLLEHASRNASRRSPP